MTGNTNLTDEKIAEVKANGFENQQVDVISHNTISNPWTVPSDGYLKLVISSSQIGNALHCNTLTNLSIASAKVWLADGTTTINTVYIRKGMQLYFTFSGSATCHAYFVGIK